MELLDKAHNVYKALMAESDDAGQAFAILNLVNTIAQYEVQAEQQRLLMQQQSMIAQVPGRRQ